MLVNPTNPPKPEDYGSGGGDVISWGLGIEESRVRGLSWRRRDSDRSRVSIDGGEFVGTRAGSGMLMSWGWSNRSTSQF
jgi:hypothetical protein